MLFFYFVFIVELYLFAELSRCKGVWHKDEAQGTGGIQKVKNEVNPLGPPSYPLLLAVKTETETR